MYSCEMLESYFVGKRAKANHPITCLNPEEYFIIEKIRFETRLDEVVMMVKGANTCWWGKNSYTILD